MTNDEITARAQALIDRKYVARNDVRQRALGLAYIEAERQDLAKEIAEFASNEKANLLAFASRIARMTQDGEKTEGREFVMENDDAVSTLNDLIEEARGLTTTKAADEADSCENCGREFSEDEDRTVSEDGHFCDDCIARWKIDGDGDAIAATTGKEAV